MVKPSRRSRWWLAATSSAAICTVDVPLQISAADEELVARVALVRLVVFLIANQTHVSVQAVFLSERLRICMNLKWTQTLMHSFNVTVHISFETKLYATFVAHERFLLLVNG